jgi:hypothetical protein
MSLILLEHDLEGSLVDELWTSGAIEVNDCGIVLPSKVATHHSGGHETERPIERLMIVK